MYAPGLFGSSVLILKSPYLASFLGLLIFSAAAALLASGQYLYNFAVGMCLCGLAWNLTFSAATVLLTTTYLPEEALRLQAINDGFILTFAGLGSFASGYIYVSHSWNYLIFIVSGLMVLCAFGLFLWRILAYFLSSHSFKRISMNQLSQDQDDEEAAVAVQDDNNVVSPMTRQHSCNNDNFSS